jgi:hypothetical protein
VPLCEEVRQVGLLVLIALACNQRSGISASGLEVYPPKGDLHIEIGEMPTLKVVDEIRRREEKPVNR